MVVCCSAGVQGTPTADQQPAFPAGSQSGESEADPRLLQQGRGIELSMCAALPTLALPAVFLAVLLACCWPGPCTRHNAAQQHATTADAAWHDAQSVLEPQSHCP